MRQVDVVGAVIIDREKGILCAQRGVNKAQGGLWEFPGGKVEKGEEPREALVREIREELGCEIEVGDLLKDHTHDYPSLRVHLQTYAASVLSGRPAAIEHRELRWVKPEELHNLEWAPADLPTLEVLRGMTV